MNFNDLLLTTTMLLSLGLAILVAANSVIHFREFNNPPVTQTPSTTNGSYITQSDFNALSEAIVRGCK